MLSNTTISPFFSTFATLVLAPFSGLRSGFLCSSIGVGTVTIKKFASFILSSSLLKLMPLSSTFFIALSSSSKVRSKPLFSSFILVLFRSKPKTLNLLLKAAASGIPT